MAMPIDELLKKHDETRAAYENAERQYLTANSALLEAHKQTVAAAGVYVNALIEQSRAGDAVAVAVNQLQGAIADWHTSTIEARIAGPTSSIAALRQR